MASTVNENEGSDPTDNIKKQNPGETIATNGISADDPHKTEKLAEFGRDEDADAESD